MYDFTAEFDRKTETLFKSEAGILYPAIPVKWDNVPFKQPSNGRWFEIIAMQNQQKQVSLGNKFIVRTTGFIQIDVMDREEAGSLWAKTACEALTNIFAYRKFKGENINISFSEKHVTKPMAAAEFIRSMGRIFFYYDGERLRETPQALS